MYASLTVDQFAEVLIASDEWSRKGIRLRQDFVVGDTRAELSYVHDHMAVRSQLLHDLALYTFIANEVHAAASGAG
jgi:hypothetical protein